jgi:hypothetical protein
MRLKESGIKVNNKSSFIYQVSYRISKKKNKSFLPY